MTMASAARRISARSGVTSPMMRTARPGPGKGWRHTISSGSPSSSPTARTSSLNSGRRGSTSAKAMSSGSPPTLWCDLMVAASPRARLDDVGVQRALHEEAGVLDVGGHLFEDADEGLPDGLALGFGIGDALEHAEEPVGRLDVDQVHVELAPERLLHLVGLARAHEPGVDEHTGELVADGPVHEGGRHGRVDPARQGAQHAGVGDLGPHRLDRGLDDVGVGPQRDGPRTRRRGSARAAPGPARCGPPRDGTAPRRCGVRASLSAATGASGVEALATKPAGTSVMESAWLIHTSAGPWGGQSANSGERGAAGERWCARTRRARCGPRCRRAAG